MAIMMNNKIACVVIEHYATLPPSSEAIPLSASPTRKGENEGYYEGYQQEPGTGLLDLLEEFSPSVESDGPNLIYFDAAGLNRLFGEDAVLARRVVATIRQRLGLVARIGIGPNRFVARLAGYQAGDGPVVIPPDRVGEFLASQSCHLLPVSTGVQDRLKLLGIDTIGQFVRLATGSSPTTPVEDLRMQFGPEAITAFYQAIGVERNSLLPRRREQALVATREFEPALLDRERFRHVTTRLMARLVVRLQREYRSCQQLCLSLEFEDGTRSEEATCFGEPVESLDKLSRAVERLAVRATGRSSLKPGSKDGPIDFDTELVSDPGGVVRMEVALLCLGQQYGQQACLFDARPERRGTLEQAVDRIESRFGHRIKRLIVGDEAALFPERRFCREDYVQ